MFRVFFAALAIFALSGCTFLKGVLESSRERAQLVTQAISSELEGEWTDESGNLVTIKSYSVDAYAEIKREGQESRLAMVSFSDAKDATAPAGFQAMELQFLSLTKVERIFFTSPGKIVDESRGLTWLKNTDEWKQEAEEDVAEPFVQNDVEYVIRSKHSGWVLDNDGNRVYTYPLHETAVGPIQRWKFKYDEAADSYTIWNVHAEKFAYVIRDSSYKRNPWILKLQSVKEEDAMRFKLEPTDDNYSFHDFYINPRRSRPPYSSILFDSKPYWNHDSSSTIGITDVRDDKSVWELLPAESIDTFREPDAKIAFLNEGGYLANFEVVYDNEVKLQEKNIEQQEIKDLFDGKSHELTTILVPPRADVRVIASVAFAGGKVADIFDLELGNLDAGSFTCFKAYATAFDPKYNQNCEQFGVKSIEVINNTDEKIYAAWTDELIWSLSNVTTGLLTGLLLDNANNLNSSFFRYFAIANAVGLEIPKSLYEMFQAGSIEIDKGGHEIVLRDNPWAQIGHAKSLIFDIDSKKDAAKYVVGWLKNSAEQTDQYKAEYMQYNPGLFIFDQLGADTKTIMVVNESMTKFWIIDSGVDDSWVVTDDYITKADKESLKVTDKNAPREAAIAIK